jgi:hypothetical protein
MKLLIGLFSICYLTIFCQTKESESVNRKGTIKEFLVNRRDQNLSIELIQGAVDSISSLTELSSAIKSNIFPECLAITNRINLLRSAEKDQKETSIYELKSSIAKYKNQKIIVIGEVSDITKNNESEYTIEISKYLKCMFPKSIKDALKRISNGQRVLVKGTLEYSDNSVATMKNCSFFTPKNLSVDLNKIQADAHELIVNTISLLENEIQQYQVNKISNLQKEGDDKYNAGEYESALNIYRQLTSLNSTGSELAKKITLTEKYIQYNLAKKMLVEQPEKAGKILYDLAYPVDFNSSRELFHTFFSKKCSTDAKSHYLMQDVSGYLDLFENIDEIIYKTKDIYYDTLRLSFKKEFEQVIVKHYSSDRDLYTLVPGGYYTDNLSKNKIYVKAFLVNPVPVDSQLIKAYNILFDERINSNVSFMGKYAKIKLENWLKLKFISPEQIEFIKCDGWESDGQRELFTGNSSNYKIDISDNLLVLDVEDITNATEVSALKSKEAQLKENIIKSIEASKEYAYRVKRVTENYYLTIAPSISYLSERNVIADPRIIKDTTFTIGNRGFSFEMELGVILNDRDKVEDKTRIDGLYYYNINALILGVFYRFNYMPFITDNKFNDLKNNDIQLNKPVYTMHDVGLCFSFPYFVFPVKISAGYSFKNFKGEIVYGNRKPSTEQYQYSSNSVFFAGSMQVLFFYVSTEVHIGQNEGIMKTSEHFNIGVQYPIWLWHKDPK